MESLKIKNLINYTIKNGGVTFDKKLDILENLKGYTISLAKYEYKTNIKNINDIIKNINDKINVLNNKLKNKNFVLGLWIYDNILYIDINKIELNYTRALKLAKQENQIAIFNNVNKKEITIKKDFTYILYEYIEKINDLKYVNEFTNKKELIDFTKFYEFRNIKKYIYNDFNNNIKDYFIKNNKKYIIIKESV